MSTKYYTPTIEELFEYIVNEKKLISNKDKVELNFGKTNAELVTSVYSFIKSNDMSINAYTFNYSINIELYRIKYLDREDIESFGFTFVGTTIDNWYELKTERVRPLSNFCNRVFTLQHDFITNQGIIIKGYEYENKSGSEETIFRGSCNNKAELRKMDEEWMK